MPTPSQNRQSASIRQGHSNPTWYGKNTSHVRYDPMGMHSGLSSVWDDSTPANPSKVAANANAKANAKANANAKAKAWSETLNEFSKRGGHIRKRKSTRRRKRRQTKLNYSK